MPRFRQRAEPDALSIAPPRWEPDPWFDLNFHVARVTSAGDGSRRDVLDLASKVAMQSFDLARPLWRLVLVEGLEDGGAALILKLHHSVTDALGFFRVVGHLVQVGRDDDVALADEADVRVRLSALQRLLDAALYRVRGTGRLLARAGGGVLAVAKTLVAGPGAALGSFAQLLGSLLRVFKPEFTPKSPLMRERSLNTRLDTISLPLEDLRAAAKQSGGKLNDAFLAGLAGGMARYHADHGLPVGSLRLNMPINFRAGDAGGEGGNYFIPARFLLPISSDDPVERMRQASKIVADVRAEPALAKFGSAVGALNVLPALSRPLFGAILKGVDVNASNVPGPPVALYCAGAQITEMFPATPLAGAAVSVSLLSYNGMVHLTINTDTAAVPDAKRLVECLQQGFDEVLACAETTVLEQTR
jgi:WS/DGAT/MGAT family acyltransferase